MWVESRTFSVISENIKLDIRFNYLTDFRHKASPLSSFPILELAPVRVYVFYTCRTAGILAFFDILGGQRGAAKHPFVVNMHSGIFGRPRLDEDKRWIWRVTTYTEYIVAYYTLKVNDH